MTSWTVRSARWRKFRALTWSERRLLVKAGLVLPLIGITLRLIGFAKCQSVLSYLVRPRAGKPASQESLDWARSIGRLIRIAGESSVFRATCLPQSILLWSLMRHEGVEAAIRVGVRKADDRVTAHAWVESGGIAINEQADVHDRFTAFDRVIAQ
jgi:Transglutaminase-like superfamily